MLDSNTTRAFQKWWNFVDSKGIKLTEWQSDVAVAWITDQPLKVQIYRGAGQSFIHNLLREFEATHDRRA